MSCGNHHEIPCSQVVRAMWLYLDNEPAGVDRSLIDAHLAECMPCASHSAIEAQFKALLARALCVEPAPDRVRSRVQAQITRIQVQISRVERRGE